MYLNINTSYKVHMSLRDVDIKMEYRSLIDNVAKDFYVPLLKEAVSYKRAVGFFNSSSLVEISKGIMGLVKNGGHIKLIVSPHLSEDDIEAIRKGYKQREEIINNAIIDELKEPENEYQAERLNMLANLIADEIMDVKIAITESDSVIGMYHEKVGVIEDSEGNKIAFSGSMNESRNAFCANYETIDVFSSWTSDEKRVKNKENSFDAIWNNCELNVRTYDFYEITDVFIEKYRTKEIDYNNYNYSMDNIEMIERDYCFFKIPADVEFYDYQKEAMTNWIDKSCCGIYDMATGTGKTYTALGSLTRLSQMLNEQIAVVIVAPYKHLVQQWVDDIKKFNVTPIIAYSYRGQKWRKEFYDAVQGYNTGAIKHFCIISTNATFSSNDFQDILLKFRKNYCFVVDEAHNLGAEKISKLLPKKARYRLALSATIERHRDEKGTEQLKKYFGKEPCISFGLKEAIKNGFLTPYYYYPVFVYLNEYELDDYNEYTKKIMKMSKCMENNAEISKYVERLMIERARIVAGCKSKVDKLIEIIEQYKDEHHMLIYCGATKYDRDDISDDNEIRQIDEVNFRLYSELGMKVRKFTSAEDSSERDEIKEMFVSETIQAITAIKCLDEGVNIPAIKRAFILASSTNPKEYIQRRGRVLRKAKGKEYAEIYDFITLPRSLEEVKYCSEEEKEYDLSLVKREFTRMIDFAETARNPFEIDMMKQEIQNIYHSEIYMEENTYE